MKLWLFIIIFLPKRRFDYLYLFQILIYWAVWCISLSVMFIFFGAINLRDTEKLTEPQMIITKYQKIKLVEWD